jgi:uncharacterized integral membrane protein
VADPDEERRYADARPRTRLRWRVGTVVALFVLSLFVFRAPATTTLALATAPGADPGRTLGLLLVLAGGALVGPLVIGSLLGDWLYDRFGDRRA